MNIPNHEVFEAHGNANDYSSNPPLKQAVKNALENYLIHLDYQNPVNLYELVLKEIELPLFEVVMKLAKNNQSKAAKLLGLSRGTLRKKLKQYNLDVDND